MEGGEEADCGTTPGAQRSDGGSRDEGAGAARRQEPVSSIFVEMGGSGPQ